MAWVERGPSVRRRLRRPSEETPWNASSAWARSMSARARPVPTNAKAVGFGAAVGPVEASSTSWAGEEIAIAVVTGHQFRTSDDGVGRGAPSPGAPAFYLPRAFWTAP
jgi:hypothetical protein